jgi:shikimate kinase
VKIVLIGFMGSGKTVFGKKLAQYLNLNFVDLDLHIEQKYKMTIPSIFTNFDESVFRNLESIEIKQILSEDNLILSCGGGTPCFNNNMDLINNYGISIYLELNEKALADRLSKSKSKRPIINNLNIEELIIKITELLKSRDKFYRQAKITVSSINIKLEEVVNLIKLLDVE